MWSRKYRCKFLNNLLRFYYEFENNFNNLTINFLDNQFSLLLFRKCPGGTVQGGSVRSPVFIFISPYIYMLFIHLIGVNFFLIIILSSPMSSGAMYSGVPLMLSSTYLSIAIFLEKPKSHSLAVPCRVIRMFCGWERFKCLKFEKLNIWNVWDLKHSKFEMFKIWNVWYSKFGMFTIWYV